MKHLLFTLLLALSAPVAILAAPAPHCHPAARPAEPTVYVCMSPTSYAYHSSSDCAGLNRCSHPVKALSATEAGKLGKRACKKCW